MQKKIEKKEELLKFCIFCTIAVNALLTNRWFCFAVCIKKFFIAKFAWDNKVEDYKSEVTEGHKE